MESFSRRGFYSPFPLLLTATFISASGGSRDVVSDDGESHCQWDKQLYGRVCDNVNSNTACRNFTTRMDTNGDGIAS
jgi:hypothetical protein